MALQTPRQALAFVRRHGIVTMTRHAARPSLVEAVAGGPVRGSWWGHPKGQAIFRLAESLHDSKEVLSFKLVDGKVTFLHKSLWPALARVVTDPMWRKAAGSRLGPGARTLLQGAERRGSIRPDGGSKAAKVELERSLLVHSGSVHTEKGSHATVFTSWRKVFNSKTLALARRLSLPESLTLLGLA